LLWLILKWWYPSFSKYKYASKHLLLSRPDDTSSFTLTRLSPPLALDNLLVNLHHSPWTTYPSISTTRPGPPTRQSPPLALDHLLVNLHHSPWTTYPSISTTRPGPPIFSLSCCSASKHTLFSQYYSSLWKFYISQWKLRVTKTMQNFNTKENIPSYEKLLKYMFK